MNHFGLDRIGQAWSTDLPTRVMSESLYTFDLDDGVLEIEDRDFIFVSRGTSALALPKGRHALKQFRRTAKDPKYAFMTLPDEFTSDNILRGKPVPGIELEHSVGRDTATFTMTLKEAQPLRAGQRYRLDLKYSVPLNGQGRVLLFTGAIQPSDYDIVNQLGIQSAWKAVTVVVRRSVKFQAHFFLPEDMHYFPIAEEAGYLAERRCFQVTHTLFATLQGFRRARYFTVAVVQW